MKWIEPKYPKENVKKAGKTLLQPPANISDISEAVSVFHNWRAAHAFPTQIMLDLLRKNSIRVDKDALVVQRLKRVPSILAKLYREKNMSLSRMEDIGGCRAVLSDVSKVYKVCENLKNSRTKNILHRERNYINNPKESGYRGIHLVFKYNGRKEKFRGIAVEMQIRSKIQHSWATAVEVVGTFTKQALKASMGDDLWLDFFKYSSDQFSKLEGFSGQPNNTEINSFEEMDRLSQLIGVPGKLGAFNVVVKELTSNGDMGAGYFILLLEVAKGNIYIFRYNKSELKKATDFYDSLEEENKDDADVDVVLVSAKSLNDLKKAYPNYFSDTLEFQKNIEEVYKYN